MKTGREMKSFLKIVTLRAAVTIALVGAGASWAQDPAAIINQRQEAMKAQGRSLGAIRNFMEDKADLAAARAAGAQLEQSLQAIPSLFPQQTGVTEFPGKTRAKPEIWAQWDRFTQANQAAVGQTQALNAALQTGDKAAIGAALGNLARDVPGATPNPGGCGACHGPFRAPQG